MATRRATLGRLRARFPQGGFGRNVLVLFTGPTIAQAISVLASPILTRLYSPAEYGTYAFILAISNVVIGIVACRYELAIILPKHDEDAFNLLALAVIITCETSVLALVAVVLFGHQIAHLLNAPEAASWLYAVPGMLLALGIYNVFNYWNNRRKNFKRLATKSNHPELALSHSQCGNGIRRLWSAGLGPWLVHWASDNDHTVRMANPVWGSRLSAKLVAGCDQTSGNPISRLSPIPGPI
jgi:hypothetical protein